MIPIKNNKFIKDNLEINNYNIVPNKVLLSIKNVLTERECNKIIKMTEKNGYKKASLYTDDKGKEHFYEEFRKSDRCIIDDERFVKKLEKRIYDYIPKIYDNKKYHSINPRCRFQKYKNNGYFARHSDSYYKSGSLISCITILIYLNDDYEGGFTTFFSNPSDTKGFLLKPEIGMICLMDQDIGHEVPHLTSGIKYVIRTELMYTYIDN